MGGVGAGTPDLRQAPERMKIMRDLYDGDYDYEDSYDAALHDAAELVFGGAR